MTLAIIQRFTEHPVTPDSDLVRDLDIHLIDLMLSLPMALEEHCGVDIPDADVSKWETVGDVVRCLEGLGV